MKRFLILAAACLVACAESDDLLGNDTKPVEKNPYEISIESAMQTLETMFPEMMRTTRVGASEVKTLRRSDLGMATRADDADPQAPIAYIIPLANNGCAIMGADVRQERLYAALESTTLTPDDIARAFQQQQTTRSSNATDNEGTDGEFEQIDDIKEFTSGLIADAITKDLEVSDKNETNLASIANDRDTIVEISDTIFLKTKWHQFEPFNNRMLKPYNQQRLPAGCAAIAMAQILYYLHTPDVINGYTVDWEALEWLEYYFYNYTNVESFNAAADFVYNIRELMGYDNPAGSTPSNNGDLICFQGAVTNSVQKIVGINSSLIQQMLYNNLPVYMQGSRLVESNPGQYKYVGHAWVVDGYKFVEKYIYEYGYQIDYNIKRFVHCNYGWRGECDGYYTLGVFDCREELDEDMVDISSGDIISSNDYYYDSLFSFLYYYYQL